MVIEIKFIINFDAEKLYIPLTRNSMTINYKRSISIIVWY